MKIINIFAPPKNSELQIHDDDRGLIADIFYNATLNHACFLKSRPNAIRGNHYHKTSTQHTLLLTGKMKYWYQPADNSTHVRCVEMYPGDLVTSEPNEIHTLQFLMDSTCVVFTDGERGGADYENDTYRVDNIII